MRAVNIVINPGQLTRDTGPVLPIHYVEFSFQLTGTVRSDQSQWWMINVSFERYFHTDHESRSFFGSLWVPDCL